MNLIFIFAITLLDFVFCCYSISYGNDLERNALISLYESTNGDNWINNTNWLSDKPLDMWHGISLNELGYIQVIGLSFNNLIGSLNDELNCLANITALDLGYNDLTGTIPSSYGNLTNIEYISIDGNFIEGPIHFVKNYLLLQSIHIANNQITGSLDVNSSYLVEAYCSYNFFTGILFKNMSPQLYYFNIESNYFTGSIPNLANNTNLNTINIQENYLSRLLPQFPVNLYQIYAADNLLSGPIMIEWGKYKYLWLILLDGNFFTGTLTSVSSNSIEYFQITENFLTGLVPQFTSISRFQEIGVAENYFSGSLPNDFDKSCQLQLFKYGKNYIEGIIPSSLGNCILMSNFVVSNNYLNGTIPDTFIHMQTVVKLIVSQNYLSGTISSKMISSMKFLENYEISQNKFEGTIPGAFSDSRWLRILFLFDNFLTGIMPYLSSKLICLVDISQNLLTGTIPIFSKAIESLVAEDNYFYGNININENFMYLTSYGIGNNYLTGSIPSDISMIRSLNAFYINSNYLVGPLPSEFCNLNNLKLLNINDLEMCVPSCLTRAAYSVSSYDFVRCQNDQDLALCSIIQQTNVYEMLSSSVQYVTEVYESRHPINTDDNSSYFNLVNISGAYKYLLTFDAWTEFNSEDYLEICADIYCKSILISYDINKIPGIDGNAALELFYPYFYINIYTNHVENTLKYWGYLVSVKAYFPLIGWNCTSPSAISQSYDNETLSKYNLTLSSSYAVDICNNSNNWRGIECTFVSVTSLSLESYGISGTIPSSLTLLTALEQLYLSYNSLSGSLPISIGNLTNLQVLDLSNNKLTDEIPSELGQLTQLQYLYLQSNDWVGTIPESLAYLNESLQLMSLSANQLGGKLTSDLCPLSNASIDVSGNRLICYEECWDQVNGKSLKSGDLSMCAPTSYPTSQPSSPTFKPTSINGSNISSYLVEFAYIFATILLVILTFLIYRYVNSKERKLRYIRNRVLEKLPIHRYILEHKSNNEILQILRYASPTIANEDYDGNNVIDLALDYKLNNEIITSILKQLLSMQLDESAISNDFKYAWIRVIQLDLYVDSVRHVLDVFYSLSRTLSDCLDENGRSAVNIASPLCRQAIKESQYFLRRYDLGNNIYPTHVSETSIIYMATDTLYSEESKMTVAIKFISNKNSYINEIRSRIELSTESDSIIPILDSFDASINSYYDYEIRRRKLDNYLYCIIMPAGEKNLSNIIGTERIAGKDWTQLKVITTQLALSIKQLHSKQYIHGDIKPLNVIRLGNEIKLIDLDACAKVGSDYYGNKFSQAYVPPEFICSDHKDNLMNRPSLPADYSQDSWSLGMLLYELYTGISFFLKDYDDDIDIESLALLYDFNDEYKQKKLSKISDRYARNLVSLLLDKDPNKRLSISRVLEHPFITGKLAVRLKGEEPDYDIFISYRVESDLHHAEKIYDLLSSHGFKVWFDKSSLLPGLNWEVGISDGLVRSRVLVPIISRNSLSDPASHRSNIVLLHEDSHCDNVLLEYELALELKERGLITQIYPVLIGDFDDEKNEYLDYFSSGCYPKDMKNIIVKSVDKNVRSHLNRLGLGSKLIDYDGVKSIVESIFKCQGIIYRGSEEKALKSIIDDIESMKFTIQ